MLTMILRAALAVLLCMSFPLHAAEVRLQGNGLTVDGRPFALRGAAAIDHLEALAAAGGNTVRIYGEEAADLFDQAQRHGLKVVAGIRLTPPRLGFDYSDERLLAAREAKVRDYVLRWRDHPALLMWNVGNELEMEVADPAPAWAYANRLAKLIKQLDPKHPVMTTVADVDPVKLPRLAAVAPDFDLLGINAYGGSIESLGARLRATGWRKPALVAEYGPLGQWEAQKSPWGAPYEPDSTAKAELYGRWSRAIAAQPEFIGGFAFLWGQKQEQTSTWHGLFLDSGEALGGVDALTELWSGKPPANRAPVIDGKWISGDRFAPGSAQRANAPAHDPDGDALSWSWAVVEEAADLRVGGDAEAVPPAITGAIVEAKGFETSFRAPDRPGAYRLFVTIRDGKGKAATANMPFLVQ